MLVGFLIYILYIICCTFETIYFPPKNNEFIERLPIFIPRVINSWGITLDNYIYRLVKLFFVKIRCFTDVTSGTGTATLPEHPSSPQVFSGVRVTLSLVFCVCFVDQCLPFCPFSFGHCVVCPS